MGGWGEPGGFLSRFCRLLVGGRAWGVATATTRGNGPLWSALRFWDGVRPRRLFGWTLSQRGLRSGGAVPIPKPAAALLAYATPHARPLCTGRAVGEDPLGIHQHTGSGFNNGWRSLGVGRVCCFGVGAQCQTKVTWEDHSDWVGVINVRQCTPIGLGRGGPGATRASVRTRGY